MVSALVFTPQVWPRAVAVLIAALLAAYIWPRRVVRGGKLFFVCLAALLSLFLLEILTDAVNALPYRFFLYQTWGVVGAWSSLLPLWLAIDYAGLAGRMPRRGWALLAAPVAIFSALIATNSTHGWVWSELRDAGGLQSTLGVVGLLGSGYLYTLVLVSSVIIFVAARRARGVLRWQAAWLATGGLVICAGVFLQARYYHGAPGFAFAPLLSTAGLLIDAYALFRLRAFDLAPTARHTLVEQMNCGMMVLDGKQRIVDLNPAAGHLLQIDRRKVIGRTVSSALPDWPELVQAIYRDGGAPTEVACTAGQAERILEVNVSLLPDSAGGHLARLALWSDVTEKKAAQAEIDRQRTALAVLGERERLGRELHDGLAQALGCVKLQAQAACDALDRACPGEARVVLASMLAVAQDAHEEVRDFLLGAKTTIQPDGRFWDAVTDYAARYTRVYGLAVRVSVSEGLEALHVDPLTQVQLLRVIQEALANVRRHAGVSAASLTVTHEDGHLCLAVHDDGGGFEPGSVPAQGDGHYGLGFMRERAEAIGGALELISALGQGTEVRVRVPLAGKELRDAAAVGG